jgi:hypothetical protein
VGGVVRQLGLAAVAKSSDLTPQAVGERVRAWGQR